MKKLLTLVAMSVSLSLGLANAADVPAAKAKTPQQNKMAQCNKDAVGKKGDERKAFMKDCLSAKPDAATAAPAPAVVAKPATASDKKLTQQEKMKTCNKDAGDKKLKGDERKKFMSDCLKA
jgi:hypothetical protein